jgi:putative protease
LGHQKFSRAGTLSTEEILTLSKKLRAQGKKVVFEWDVLSTESELRESITFFEKEGFENFDAFRVCDMGVASYLVQSTSQPIQLNVENAFHNLASLKTLKTSFEGRIEKLIVSNEIPFPKLIQYQDELQIELEVLSLGALLLFYTPRPLLSSTKVLDSDQESGLRNGPLHFLGNSEESPHKGFQLTENQHGTFMYNPKDLSLLDRQDLLGESLLSQRVDLRGHFEEQKTQAFEQYLDLKDYSKFKENYPTDLTRGFFHVNKTNVQFSKLKNARVQRKDEGFLGHIIDVHKKGYLALQLKNPNQSLTVGTKVKLLSAEGREKEFLISEMKNTNREPLMTASSPDIVLINYCSGASKKSALYLQN